MKTKVLSFPGTPGQQTTVPRAKRPFEDFYRAWYSKVLHYLSSRCSSVSDAEDIASQTFLYAWQHYDRYDPERASESTWIFMIAISRWKNAVRDRQEYVDLDSLGDLLGTKNDPAYQAACMTEIRSRVAEALLGFPEDTREMMIMKWFHGLSAQEIADRMGIAAGAVRTRLSRALDRMEEMLSDLGE